MHLTPRMAVYLAIVVAMGAVALWPGWDPLVFWMLVALFALGLVHGVAIPHSPIITKSHCRGPRGARGVALTFDDGPHPEFTPKALDLLSSYEAKATFFVIGERARAHPELLQRMVREGHAIGSHSLTHPRSMPIKVPRKLRAEIEGGIEAVREAVGYEPRLYRQPMGLVNRWTDTAVKDAQLTLVGWSVVTHDNRRHRDLEAARHRGERVGRRLRDGDIVLLHDSHDKAPDSPEVAEKRRGSLAILEGMLTALKERNMQTVTVDRILDVPLARERMNRGHRPAVEAA